MTDHLFVQFIVRNLGETEVQKVLKWLLETELYYEKNEGQHRLSKRKLPTLEIGEKVKETTSLDKTNFENSILFLDEALSPKSRQDKKTQEGALERIKFLRNLGRVLGMRVCIAGTSSVCANIFEKTRSTGTDASRVLTTRTLQRMDFHFLWRPMTSQSSAVKIHTWWVHRICNGHQ